MPSVAPRSKGLLSNPIMLVWVAAAAVALLLVFTLPGLAGQLDLVPLSAGQWGILIVFSVVCTCWAEAVKWLALLVQHMSGTIAASQFSQIVD
jgi:hypothetical protein